MKLEIGPGEAVIITLQGTDGEFMIAWGKVALIVHADLPDTEGREGIIYREEFGDLKLKEKKEDREHGVQN